jgi:hypothetical protein
MEHFSTEIGELCCFVICDLRTARSKVRYESWLILENTEGQEGAKRHITE